MARDRSTKAHSGGIALVARLPLHHGLSVLDCAKNFVDSI